MSRAETVRTADEWNKVIQYDTNSYKLAFQSFLKQMKLIEEWDRSLTVDVLKSSFQSLNTRAKSVSEILKAPEEFLDYLEELTDLFKTLISEFEIDREGADVKVLAQQASEAVVKLTKSLIESDYLLFEEVKPLSDPTRKGSFIFGKDDLSQRMKENGITFLNGGETKNLQYQDLPPVLDISKMKITKDEENSNENSSPLSPTKETLTSPLSPKDETRRIGVKSYATVQTKTVEKGYDEPMAKFTKESGKFCKWMILPPQQRAPDVGRTSLGEIVKQVDIIRSLSSNTNSNLGIEKHVERIVHIFQKIEFKSEEVLPQILVQQATTCLILIAGTIKAMVAMNILEKRRALLISRDISQEVRKIFRCIIVGHEGCGKTSFLRKFLRKSPPQSPTQGIELKVSKNMLDGEPVEMHIMDVSGKKIFREMLEEFYALVEGVIVMYDISSAESFGDIHLWMKDLDKFTFLQKIIIGNKSDSESKREVPTWRGQNLAEEYGVTFMECNSFDQDLVDDSFFTLARTIQKSLIPKKDGNETESDEEADNFTKIEVEYERDGRKRTHTTNSEKIVKKYEGRIIKRSKYSFFTPT